MVTKALNGRTKLSTKVFQVLHMQTHCVSSCTNSLSLLLTVFLPYLCPCYCPCPGNGPSAYSTFQSLSGPSQRRVDDDCQGSHGFSQRIAIRSCRSCHSGFSGPHWLFSIYFSPALLAFRQHSLYQKGLCQKLENVPNNGEKNTLI